MLNNYSISIEESF